MTIRFGGAIDGVEVMAVIFAKGLGLTVGTFVMIYNVLPLHRHRLYFQKLGAAAVFHRDLLRGYQGGGLHCGGS